MDINKTNSEGWDELVNSKVIYSNTSLPFYGPFMESEDKLQLFKDIKDSNVLELGCAKGKSLKYLKSKGAKEVWGIDISKEQINLAKENGLDENHLFIGPMTGNYNIPNNYFDYVLSLYSIGYSSNLEKTISKANSYLKPHGKFIICWMHPFFNCLDIENEKVIVNKSYYDESPKYIKKGPNKVVLAQYNYKISTIINNLVSLGFKITKVLEENPLKEKMTDDYESPYWDTRKLAYSPTTLLIVAEKE
jgi:SAM-dependent methyltransferase